MNAEMVRTKRGIFNHAREGWRAKSMFTMDRINEFARPKPSLAKVAWLDRPNPCPEVKALPHGQAT